MTRDAANELELLKIQSKNVLEEATERLRQTQKHTIIWIVGTVAMCTIAIIVALKFL